MSSFNNQNIEFSNKNLYGFSSIEESFSVHASRPLWVVSSPEGIPYNPFKKCNASCARPEDWFSLSEAIKWCEQNHAYLPALSLRSTPLCVIDLDGVINEGVITPWALEIVEKLNSYTEVSRSGQGLHIFTIGQKPGKRCKSGGFEIYDGNNEKFITVTGNIYRGQREIKEVSRDAIDGIYHKFVYEKIPFNESPKSPSKSDDEVISLCRKAANKIKFEALFDKGDLQFYQGDDSSADLGLCTCIAFYTQDSDQIYRIFQKSALYQKPDRQRKWEREDYRTSTIQKAIQGCSSYYQTKGKQETKIKGGTWENPSPIVMEEDLDLPCPIECLPQSMQIAVREVERSVQVDPAMAMIPALGITALQLGKKVIVVEKEGLEHHPSLFLLCVMKQVERKSETCKRILDLIKDEIDQEYEEYNKTKARVKAHNEAVEEQIAAIKLEIRKGKDGTPIEEMKKQMEDLILSKMEFPAPPQNWGDDITPERLQQRLHIHNGTFGLFSSEGRSVLHRIRDKDDTGGSVGKSIYTAATWGDDLQRSRVGAKGEPEECNVRRPALTITLFVQEDVWTEFYQDTTMRQNGTLSRICVVNPPSRAGSRLEQEEEEPFKPEKIKPFADAVIRIRKWNPEKPLYIHLSKEAKQARREFYNNLEKESGPGGKYEDVADIVGRGCSLATKMAAVFNVMEAAEKGPLSDSSSPITEEQWLRAQALLEYFLSQSIDFQRMNLSSNSDHLIQKVARWLLKQLKNQNTRVLISQMKRGVRGIENESIQNQIITSFEAMGWIRKEKEIKPTRFSYEINPQIQKYSGDFNA